MCSSSVPGGANLRRELVVVRVEPCTQLGAEGGDLHVGRYRNPATTRGGPGDDLARRPVADRRRVGRRRERRDVRDDLAVDRGSARHHGRRQRRRRATRDRRRPARVRHDRMVARPRPARPLPAPASPGDGRQLRADLARSSCTRSGAPVSSTSGPAARRPDRCRRLVRRPARGLRVHRRPRRARHDGRPLQPLGREGSGRSRRRDHRVQLPDPTRDREARTGARSRMHRRAQGRARHAVGDARARQPDRGVDRHPGGRRQRAVVVRQRGRGRAHHASRHRRRVVHRVDTGRAADHGRGERNGEAGVPRTRREVGVRRARRRRHQHGCAVLFLRDDLALGAGLRDHVASRRAPCSLRRSGRDRPHDARPASRTATRPTPRT